MKIFLATWFEPGQKESLDLLGQENRLLSYFFCLPEKKECLQEYVIPNKKEDKE